MTTPILTPLDLKARILELKARKMQQEEELKLQFHDAMQSVSPGNLIKTGFNKLKEIPMTSGLIGSGITLGVDLISDKLLGGSGGMVKNLAKQAVSYGVTNLLGKKSETISTYAGVILNRIIKGNKKKKINPPVTEIETF
jgi:hypothetical protein